MTHIKKLFLLSVAVFVVSYNIAPNGSITIIMAAVAAQMLAAIVIMFPSLIGISFVIKATRRDVPPIRKEIEV